MVGPSPFVDDARHVKEDNPFESMMSRFDEAARLLDLDPNLYAVMRWPSRELTVYIPTFMDDGHVEIFKGFRVQHNFAQPAKASHAPDVSSTRGARSRVKGKCAVQHPLGGARAASSVTRPEAQRELAMTRRFTANSWTSSVRPRRPAPDMIRTSSDGWTGNYSSTPDTM